MLTVQVAHDPELVRIISKVKCQSNNGGAAAHLCHDDGSMIPVSVATCDPKGSCINFGLRGTNRKQYGWSGNWGAIKHKYLNANTVMLRTEHETYGLRLRI